MTSPQKVAIVTGSSKGIGAGLVTEFLKRDYCVIANSRHIIQESPFPASDSLALVAGDIGNPDTAARILGTALSRFGRVDVLVNNAGIFMSRPFIEYTIEDLRSLASVNVEGFFFITQLVIKQMLAQKFGGSVVNITSTAADHPLSAAPASLPMITKGGLEAATRSLALEYAKQRIRVNAVAPGIVDTPMHKNNPHEFLKTLQPMGDISSITDVVNAVLYLCDAAQVTGEVLRVDGGAHIGHW